MSENSGLETDMASGRDPWATMLHAIDEPRMGSQPDTILGDEEN